MTDIYDDGLGYGHLGEPEYAPESGSWTWKRSLHHSHAQAVGQPQTIVQGSANEATTGSNDSDRASKDRDPDLVSITPHIPSHNRISRDIAKALDQDDPIRGDLLVFGEVYDRSRGRSVSVAVFPADSARTKLCVMRVHDQRQGWDDNRNVYVVVPVIAGEHGYWQSPSQIQQICFHDDKDDKKGIFAVRTHQATFLLKAQFAKHVASTGSVEDPSRLKLTVLGVIPSGFIGDPMHSNLSINPWFASHFATINVEGRWQVWEAESVRETNVLNEPKELAAGIARDLQQDDQTEELKALHDGWGRVLWVRDTNTVLTCSRTTIQLVDVPSGASAMTSLESSARRARTWLLDVQRDPQRSERVFFLTSVYIYYVSVNQLDVQKYEMRSSGLRILQKVRHFRDHEDQSLRMMIPRDDPNCAVHLVSSLNPVVTRHFFAAVSISDGAQSISSDAGMVDDLPPLMTYSRLSTSVQAAHWNGEEDLRQTGFARGYRERGVRFSVLTCLSKDMTIAQQLIATWPETSKTDPPQPLTWRSKIKVTGNEVGHSSFIVDDDEDQDRPRRRIVTQTRALPPIKAVKQDVVNYERIYNQLAEPRTAATADAMAVITRVKDGLRSTSSTSAPKQHLASYLETEMSVGDLDQVADAFSDLVSQYEYHLDQRAALSLSSIGTLDLPNTDMITTMVDIKEIYHNIISRWLSPLSAEVPGRVRLAREQLARRIATTLVLANHKIQPNLPVPAVAATPSSPPLPPLYSSQSFPDQSAAPAKPKLPDPASEAALSRLSRYTTTTTPIKPLSTSTSATARILQHWNPSISPSDYDWLATRSRIAAEMTEQEETANLTTKQREKLLRKRQRLEQRRRREEERLQSQLTQSGAAPMVALSQDTRAMFPPVLGSSQIFHRPGQGRREGQAGFSTAQAQGLQAHAGLGSVEQASSQLAIRSSPPRASPSQLLSPALTRSPSAGRGRGNSRERGPQEQGLGIGMGSSQVQSSQWLSSQAQGGMGPPPRKKKKRTEGF
ncbi:Hypothetical protein D9617_21g096520 [Elsinoe fawcettii]|nr:Hypothetical protein D9617_21g096520 [Elsinoe fawcettii]